MKRKHTRRHSAPPAPRCRGTSSTSTFTLAPETSAARVLGRMVDLGGHGESMDSATLAQLLESQGLAVAAGDLACVRRSLTAQITTLERMFHHFFDLACQQEPGSDSHGRLAGLSLRAQIQSARTAAVLARLSRMPPPEPPPPPEPKVASPDEGDGTEDMTWLPDTCGPDCASHKALDRLTRWAARSPACVASITRIMTTGSSVVVASDAASGGWGGGCNVAPPQGA